MGLCREQDSGTVSTKAVQTAAAILRTAAESRSEICSIHTATLQSVLDAVNASDQHGSVPGQVISNTTHAILFSDKANATNWLLQESSHGIDAGMLSDVDRRTMFYSFQAQWPWGCMQSIAIEVLQ